MLHDTERWQGINSATYLFIRQHADEDVRQLALSGAKVKDIDLPFALQQIKGRQTARRKLPAWAANEAVVFPPHLSMEQCSSEQTARYTALLVERLLSTPAGGSEATAPFSLVDLTGGFGVDFFFMAQAAGGKAVYAERQEELCAIARHNFRVLGLENAVVHNETGERVLEQLQAADIIYLDPARRDSHGSRTYAISDCTPNVLMLLDQLLRKARFVILKLSPMLDWHKAVADLEDAAPAGSSVCEVHVVATGNECKELLLVLSRERNLQGKLVCMNDEERFTTPLELSSETASMEVGGDALHTLSSQYLYEPNAAIMKAGCFAALAKQYGCRALAPNSHLFVSSTELSGFPGRCFRIVRACTLNKKEVRQALQGIGQANVAVRNFPMKAEELRRRLKLRDGGDTYLFGTTLVDNSHILLICSRPTSGHPVTMAWSCDDQPLVTL